MRHNDERALSLSCSPVKISGKLHFSPITSNFPNISIRDSDGSLVRWRENMTGNTWENNHKADHSPRLPVYYVVRSCYGIGGRP